MLKCLVPLIFILYSAIDHCADYIYCSGCAAHVFRPGHRWTVGIVISYHFSVFVVMTAAAAVVIVVV